MSVKRPEDRIFTIPNILSIIRILLIPVYAYLYLKAEGDRDYYIAAGVMAFSAVTDCVDGIIARKCNMITVLGKIIDPIADKLTQCVVFVCLSIHWNQLFWVLGLFVLKEGFQAIMGFRLIRNKKMLSGALPAGKISTTVLFISMIILMLSPRLDRYFVNAIAILCIAAIFLSFYYYFSTLVLGGKHGIYIVPIHGEEEDK